MGDIDFDLEKSIRDILQGNKTNKSTSNNKNNTDYNSDRYLNPNIKFYCDTDKYWLSLWDKIDSCEKSIFIITYCMDNDFIANHTIRKLIK